ncbi:MAG: phosphopantothenoylcysteine decarboxylase [Phycisphaeraceae bacterium]|nr:phosphopantothenoylcysteine decarboxylase [Phycisphaerales bacterium]MCB9861556.1 phosphopantothenoylcysteine decarboxylase [Phycisphaeraceae bacterium]
MTDMRPMPLRFLITAGPCHEPIDRVRFLGNRSSGKMGIAIADHACRLGYDVTLLLGPTHLAPLEKNVLLKRYESTADLDLLLQSSLEACDVLIMAAAVADYRPVKHTPAPAKIERSPGTLRLELESTPDLVAGCAVRKRPDQTIVAFALESTEVLRERALSKLKRKKVDMIVANPLETMDSDTISAIIFDRASSVNEQSINAPVEITKSAFAEWLIERILTYRTASSPYPTGDAIETQ